MSDFAYDWWLASRDLGTACSFTPVTSIHWRHNGHDGVLNHQSHDCFLNRLLRRRSKKTPKLRVTGLCEGNSSVTGEFSAQRASNAENVSIWRGGHVPQTSSMGPRLDNSVLVASRHANVMQKRNLIETLISNYIRYKVWNEINYPFLNFSSTSQHANVIHKK